jgi:predicted glycosyltransferase
MRSNRKVDATGPRPDLGPVWVSGAAPASESWTVIQDLDGIWIEAPTAEPSGHGTGLALGTVMSASPNPRGPRVLLYSHDAVGLGHLRRSLTLAAGIAEAFPGARLLLASGSDCATRFRLPPGLDVVKLPSIGKDGDGAYRPRHLGDGLPSVLRLRRGLLRGLVEDFRPDAMLVDHKVLGIADELEPVLEQAREQGTRTLLGVRDVIDSPEVVAREWGRPAIRHALTELYDAVCVYGDPNVFDMRREYPVPEELGERLSFTGYVVRSEGLPFAPVPRLRPQVLVTTGGGEDGATRVSAYLDALELRRPDWDSVIVLGPLMDPAVARKLKRRARDLEASVRVHTFYDDLPRLVASSSVAVTMAGYNTVAELLRCRVRPVLLPRTEPRLEQAIRARRLADLGWAESLESPRPAELRAAVERSLSLGRLRGPLPPLDGARRLARLLGELLGMKSKLQEVAR